LHCVRDRARSCVGTGEVRVSDVGAVLDHGAARGRDEEEAANSESGVNVNLKTLFAKKFVKNDSDSIYGKKNSQNMFFPRKFLFLYRKLVRIAEYSDQKMPMEMFS
jgi:hypothetical protein